MDTLFLLRSYGDCTIALAAAINSNKQVRIIASLHLKELYEAILPHLPASSLSISFIDLDIDKGLLRAFTNKYFFSLQTVQELSAFKKGVNTLEEEDTNLSGNSNLSADANASLNYYVEQKRKIAWLQRLIERKLIPVHQTGNIYDSYQQFFELPATIFSTEIFSTDFLNKTVLIFPDSRLKRKEFAEQVIQTIKENPLYQPAIVKIARFSNSGKIAKDTAMNNTLNYSNFNELVNLIAEADFIISSDSLPAHIAQILKKPHAIGYASAINDEFITPFARFNNTGFTF